MYDKSELNEELCEAIIKANNPLNKLDNEGLRTFLKKYTGKDIPHESTIRNNYVDPLYEKTLENIKKDISDSLVWLSVDETTDSCGRYMVHVIVAKFSAAEAGRGHLILRKEVERTTHTTTARTVREALCVLRRSEDQKRGEYKVLAIVMASAAYILKAECLRVFYPKIIHLTCLTQGIHRVAEEVRAITRGQQPYLFGKEGFHHGTKSSEPDCPLPPEPIFTRWGTWISAENYYADNHRKVEEVLKGFEDSENLATAKAKDAMKNSSVLHSLSFTRVHLGVLPDLIEKLETRNMGVTKAVALVEGLRTQCWPGPIGERIRRKLGAVLHRNPG
ncbi:uncharacterized protein LOC126216638 [Schistocerca nitens]|uniref:uncharacterized protein LOC126216638 n=1 Tax=Schistocerca nitens TaxID=7011 RepID=UPI0021187234|nr:uncharacterized protein LOC126216638 [Schistocerca nitens]